MRHLLEARQKYGGTFITSFDDGLVVPWRTLSMGDFLKYSLEVQQGRIPLSILEDEIFRKCVTDPAILRRMPYLKAGVITTVAQNIYQASGPMSVDSYNMDIESARWLREVDGQRPIHDLVDIILSAFPYKPEEVYNMDYETFLFRAAQAEKKLMTLGYLQEPINMYDISAEEQQVQQPERPKIDAKALWDEQQAKRKNTSKNPSISNPIPPKGKWYKISPVLEAPNPKKMDIETDFNEHVAFVLDPHERNDLSIERAKLVEDAQVIYKDLLAELAKRKTNKK